MKNKLEVVILVLFLGHLPNIIKIYEPEAEMPTTTALLLAKQAKVQQDFIHLIEESQEINDCGDARVLVVDNMLDVYDGFALETRMMSYFLQTAIATGRALVINQDFHSAYAPNCDLSSNPPTLPEAPTMESSKEEKKENARVGNSYHCLWNRMSTCTEAENIGGKATNYTKPEPMGIGILEEKDRSWYFNTEYYGAKRIVKAQKFGHTDRTSHVHVLPYWERAYGRFWIRSQVTEYYWKNYRSEILKKEIEPRLSVVKKKIQPRLTRSVQDLSEPYIGFQIRMTDNVADLMADFSRNATITRSFGRYMEIANDIRKANPNTHMRHIFVATDNKDAAAAAVKNNYEGWTFHIQDGVTRGVSGKENMWFRNKRAGSVGFIGADLEMLRRADYLVGSFQSNVFRLAAELNTGYHSTKYLWDEKRIFSVDVEWYEDP